MQIPGLKNSELKNTPELMELPEGGNGLWKSGARPLLRSYINSLHDALPHILGK